MKSKTGWMEKIIDIGDVMPKKENMHCITFLVWQKVAQE